VSLVAFGAVTAFVVFAKGPRVPDSPIGGVLLLAVGLVVVFCLALYRVLDRLTLVARTVAPTVPKPKGAKTSFKSEIDGRPGAKPGCDAMDCEIGPRGFGLVPYWAGSLVLLILAGVGLVATIRSSAQPDGGVRSGSTALCLITVMILPLVWARVVRFRIRGQIATIERPYSLYGRNVSFALDEIDQVDVSHWPHNRKYGECLTITLCDGQRIKYSEKRSIINKVERSLRLAIESSRQVPHPMSDEAVR